MVFDLYQTTTRVKGDQDCSVPRHSLAAALCAQLQRMAHLRAHRQRAARPIAKPLEGLKISAKLKTTKFQASGF